MALLDDLTNKHCTVELEGHVLIATMNRPEKKNALSADMLVGLADAFDRVDADDDIRCAILTGAGGNFSTGADLVAMSNPSDDPYVQERMAAGDDLHWKALLRNDRLSKPLIAAVEGYAVAGGTEMLMGTDIRIGAETATFGVWEARRALFPLGGSACRLPRQIPYTVAMDILLTARPVTAHEAKDIGLIGRIAPHGAALDMARAVAQQVAANGPLSNQAILRAWRETEHLSDADAMAHQDAIGWEVMASEDAAEGSRAFAEKRDPVYHGR